MVVPKGKLGVCFDIPAAPVTEAHGTIHGAGSSPWLQRGQSEKDRGADTATSKGNRGVGTAGKKQALQRTATRRWQQSVLGAQSCPTLYDPVDCSHQAPLSMEFSRQEYCSGLPFPLQGTILTQGLNPGLPHCGQMLYHLSYEGIPGGKPQKLQIPKQRPEAEF